MEVTFLITFIILKCCSSFFGACQSQNLLPKNQRKRYSEVPPKVIAFPGYELVHLDNIERLKIFHQETVTRGALECAFLCAQIEDKKCTGFIYTSADKSCVMITGTIGGDVGVPCTSNGVRLYRMRYPDDPRKPTTTKKMTTTTTTALTTSNPAWCACFFVFIDPYCFYLLRNALNKVDAEKECKVVNGFSLSAPDSLEKLEVIKRYVNDQMGNTEDTEICIHVGISRKIPEMKFVYDLDGRELSMTSELWQAGYPDDNPDNMFVVITDKLRVSDGSTKCRVLCELPKPSQ